MIRLYDTIFGRQPDRLGLDFYIDAIEDRGMLLVAVFGLAVNLVAMRLLAAGSLTVLTALAGAFITLSTRGVDRTLTMEQAFLMTAAIWAVLPAAGAVPFMIGAPHASFTDAYFEAMSGLTTTGTTARTDGPSVPR